MSLGCLPARCACLIAFENGVDYMLASYPLLRYITRHVAMLKYFRLQVSCNDIFIGPPTALNKDSSIQFSTIHDHA
jgi:hypothetical protein